MQNCINLCKFNTQNLYLRNNTSLAVRSPFGFLSCKWVILNTNKGDQIKFGVI